MNHLIIDINQKSNWEFLQPTSCYTFLLVSVITGQLVINEPTDAFLSSRHAVRRLAQVKSCKPRDYIS